MSGTELQIQEALASPGVLEASTGSIFRSDGAVKVNIIRPCAGRGRGRHVYEADMLKREAAKFAGWPMYIDHETPEETRAKGGLPPSIFKLGGEVKESWWDDSVPAEGRYGQGAVSAWVMPSPWMAQMIERFPRQVQTSLNTFATGTKPRRTGGSVANVVEGFVDEGSVDWVTKAGAGGGIDLRAMESVMESWMETPTAQDDVAAWLREHRPAVVEALIKNPTDKPNHGEEDENVDPKQLLEAFNALSDDQRTQVVESIMQTDTASDAIEEAVKGVLKDVLPPALEKAGEAIEEAALAAVDERLNERESGSALLEAARKRLDGAEGLADAFREDAWARISEHADWKPVDADSDGKGGKSAQEVMEAAVDAEVKRVKGLQEAAGVKVTPAATRRTSVTGNGAGGETVTTVQEHDDRARGDGAEHLLQEAGIDFNDAWGLPKPDDKPNNEGGE